MNPLRGAIGRCEPAICANSPAHVPVALMTIGALKIPFEVSIPATAPFSTTMRVTFACEINAPPRAITVRMT